MRIGILTTHDSINYGAVLQTYAMASVYRKMGHDVRIIDRRRDPLGWPLKWELSGYSPFRRWASFMTATGAWSELKRRRRTLSFLREKVGMTDYWFRQWTEAPDDLGADLVSVGSDQVWNPEVNDPLDYLPGRLKARAISYAASFGAGTIPDSLLGTFLPAVSRLKAVSVREAEAADFLTGHGIRAAHVIDPVALAGRETWDELVRPVRPTGRLFVYLLGRRTFDDLDFLASYAARERVEIDCFVGGLLFAPLSRHGIPRLFKNWRRWRRWNREPRFHLNVSADPVEFVRALAGADAVVTSSYHALVFSALYGKNVRFVLPETGTPQVGMMARIRDYAGSVVRGPLLQPTLEAALDSARSHETTKTDDEELARRRRESFLWLENAVPIRT